MATENRKDVTARPIHTLLHTFDRAYIFYAFRYIWSRFPDSESISFYRGTRKRRPRTAAADEQALRPTGLQQLRQQRPLPELLQAVRLVHDEHLQLLQQRVEEEPDEGREVDWGGCSRGIGE